MLKNVSFETIYSNKFTSSTQAYNTKLPYLKSELRLKGFQIVVDVLLKIIIINNIVDAAFSSYTASLSVPCYSRASVSCLPSAARFCSGVLEGVVRGSFRFLQLGYCARPARKKLWLASDLTFLELPLYGFDGSLGLAIGLRVLAWITLQFHALSADNIWWINSQLKVTFEEEEFVGSWTQI